MKGAERYVGTYEVVITGTGTGAFRILMLVLYWYSNAGLNFESETECKITRGSCNKVVKYGHRLFVPVVDKFRTAERTRL